jgi:phosphomannomutase
MAFMYDLTALQNGSDIRGVALPGRPGEEVNLSEEVASLLGPAFLAWLSLKTDRPVSSFTIAIGMDSRLSGPALKNAFIQGLVAFGASVKDCGLATTPAMFMTTTLPDFLCDGAVMITASHLPFNRNGFKFFTKDGGLEKGDITQILSMATSLGAPGPKEPGKVTQVDFLPVYASYLREKIKKDIGRGERPLSPFKICVDAGNGAGGFFATEVLAPLGADITGSRYLEPDGRFPNHIPNPEDKEAMAAITEATIANGCDLGIIFDTDVDRCAVVDKEGKEINRNRLIALMSAIVLEEAPGSTIVTDSVTSDELKTFIEKNLGGVHHRFKRGYKNVINEALRLNKEGSLSLLAIETSGHGALKENYFLDDGAYMVAKILIKMAQLHQKGESLSTLLSAMADPKEAAELRLSISEENFKAYGEKVLADLAAYAKEKGWAVAPDNYEGLRISFSKDEGGGWFLLRMSLHDPLMPLNIESSKTGGCAQIAQSLMPFLEGYTQLDITPIHRYLNGKI